LTDPARDSLRGSRALLLGLLLLPLVALAWPAPTPVSKDFATTELTATGVATLLCVPLGLFLAWKHPLPLRGYLALFIALLLPANFGSPTDTLETDRAIQTFLIAILAGTGAGLLETQGKGRLVQALVLVSIALLVPALFEGAPGWGGVLGNSGELSNAALPGAIGGLVLWARSRGFWQWAGMVANALFLLHAIFAPALAGLVVAGAASAALVFLARPTSAVFRAKCLGALLIALGGAAWVKWAPADGAPSALAASEVELSGEPAATSLGGIEVRRRVWIATVGLVLANPVAGIGPGQFAARFPEYRDPVERKLSNWGYDIEQTTEVEHPHNDWLLPWAEGGVIAGLAWWLFLFGILRAAYTTLRRGEQADLANAASAIAILLAALFNAPLLYNPTASLSAFLVFGAVVGSTRRRSGHPGDKLAMVLTPGLVLLLLFSVPRALAVWRHGAALGQLATTLSTTAHKIAVAEALDACDDSVVALTFDARLREKGDGDLEAALESWDRVLELRPLRFEAWLQKGVLLARLERPDEARAAFDRAFRLDPDHPPLRRNRARLAARSGRIDDALVELDWLTERERVDAVWLRDLACEVVLYGDVQTALPLFARSDARFAEMSGDLAWALDQEYRRAGNALAADGFRALAHLLWAERHVEMLAWGDARRSYFQALRVQRDYVRPAGPTATRLEYAAALWHGGREAEARQELEGLDPSTFNWLQLPEWSREPLFALGFTSGE